MINYVKMGFCSVVLCGVVAVAGCAGRTTAPGPDQPATTDAASAPAESKRAFPARPGDSIATFPAPPKDPPRPSLEAYQRGEPTATPESSPLKDVYFDFDRYDLRADARATLKANASWLRANPLVRVEIEGHCDERGTIEYNLALGARRAQSAKDYLVALGVAADQLSTISYGKELPVCREQTEECYQRNRRAKFVIQPPPPAV